MGNQANRALKWFLWRSGDTRVPESAPRDVAKPAPEQAKVERWNAERTLQEQIPKVRDQSRANTNCNCAKDVLWFKTNGLPLDGLPPDAFSKG
jgi:hypothetical protein